MMDVPGGGVSQSLDKGFMSFRSVFGLELEGYAAIGGNLSGGRHHCIGNVHSREDMLRMHGGMGGVESKHEEFHKAIIE